MSPSCVRPLLPKSCYQSHQSATELRASAYMMRIVCSVQVTSPQEEVITRVSESGSKNEFLASGKSVKNDSSLSRSVMDGLESDSCKKWSKNVHLRTFDSFKKKQWFCVQGVK
ncbi:hypothetical protein TNIN_455991 [Trichonephila inaurata madagascariensis]|uniref:Uncharacterized protein n=1 Tax=Trichonephila inaurata madagascariensis TaxID=2747483 RepID=A0A8X6XKL7_9ARAC|nr:hypothetical protein TNIN_455991 [Trichonephila inaurata madagascariensis]